MRKAALVCAPALRRVIKPMMLTRISGNTEILIITGYLPVGKSCCAGAAHRNVIGHTPRMKASKTR
jgi:hypothetical protein